MLWASASLFLEERGMLMLNKGRKRSGLDELLRPKVPHHWSLLCYHWSFAMCRLYLYIAFLFLEVIRRESADLVTHAVLPYTRKCILCLCRIDVPRTYRDMNINVC